MAITTDFRDPESAFQSLSTFLTVHNTDYRNCAGVVNPDVFEIAGRRVYGELGYAALVVVALVETVVRGALFYGCLPFVLLYGFCTSEHRAERFAEFLVLYLGAGAVISLGNAIGCANALVRNIFERHVHYGCLFPPLSFCWAEAMRNIPQRERYYIEAAPPAAVVAVVVAPPVIAGQQPPPPAYGAAHA